MSRWLLASIVCALLAPCARAADPVAMTPEIKAPVKHFLHFYFHSYGRGLPATSQVRKMRAFITPDLANLFDAAIKGEACAGEKEPEGGPGVEGDIFSSLFEGGTSATYRLLSRTQDDATVEIEWTNDDPHEPPPFTWKDQISLVRTEKGWRISDFDHLGDWDFMFKGKLSSLLTEVSRECDP